MRVDGNGAPQPELPAHVAAVSQTAVKVALVAPGSVAAGLVGSWARGNARPDSHVDVVLLTERRLRLASGLEVEVCIGHPSWAETDPVDAGTRRIVSDGIRVLWDPYLRLGAHGGSTRSGIDAEPGIKKCR